MVRQRRSSLLSLPDTSKLMWGLERSALCSWGSNVEVIQSAVVVVVVVVAVAVARANGGCGGVAVQ